MGALLSGVLVNCSKRLKESGQGEVAQSWVNNGPDKEIAPPQLNKAIGADVDAQFGRLWLAAKKVAFWPFADNPPRTANVR